MNHFQAASRRENTATSGWPNADLAPSFLDEEIRGDTKMVTQIDGNKLGHS